MVGRDGPARRVGGTAWRAAYLAVMLYLPKSNSFDGFRIFGERQIIRPN